MNDKHKKIDRITKAKLSEYFSITSKALKKIKINSPNKTPLYKIAIDYLDMATRYFNDAKHFYNKENYVLAFAALNYAHGWLDAGARIGLFDVNHDSKLFTVD